MEIADGKLPVCYSLKRCQQLKRYSANGTKEGERMCCDICTSSLSSFVRPKGKTCALPLKNKGRRLNDNCSFVDPPIVMLGDVLKINITGWSRLMRFSFEVVIPDDR
ncbi:hypothetical protein AVEN_266409-1 [Araneus ventricosus]|uniref:Uncharacterized protein n=1 Tax=Araneus ventricosus TaxID=182803 RepID=A0A4Y2JX28_ARAVE|nr:hypothetical protein AVEN_266409-1 [Araneus ventricosus]